MADQLELILIFTAVIVGVLSAAYFYLSTDIFMTLLRRPLRLISGGMLVIAAGVLVSAFISFESSRGITVAWYGIPLQAYFYALYLVGSVMIAFGARQFTTKPKPVVSAV